MNPKKFRLDISLELSNSLFASDHLDKLQFVLRDYAPKWSASLHLWRYREPKTAIDVSIPGALKKVAAVRAVERGPLYHKLVQQFGTNGPEWMFGSVELRGANASLVLVSRLSERTFHRIGDKWIWGNSIAIQVCRPKVDGVDSVKWSRQILEELCQVMSPVYAQAHMMEEYDAKNMVQEAGSVFAIGVDYSRALPGIYWLNYLGKPYRDLIGRDRLLSSPGHEAREVGDGVLVALSEDPHLWNSPEYKATEQRLLQHFGPQYFFSRERPSRKTVAPDFGLPTELSRTGGDVS